MLVSPIAEMVYRGAPPGSTSVDDLSRLSDAPAGDQVREKFQEFVAGTFYRLWLEAMRKTANNEGSLLDGGRAERIFSAQLDQTLAERFAQTHGADLVGDLYQQWSRSQGMAEP